MAATIKSVAKSITVNGVKITPNQIDSEVQYHPASSLDQAKYQATKALIIRELLIQQSVRLGLCDPQDMHTGPDEIIDRLLELEISVPEPSAEECLRYYNNNQRRFYTSPLFEVSHILYLAPLEDAETRRLALSRAKDALQRIKKNPASFEAIAREESACTSAGLGGDLGQISKGQTVPAFEAALMVMKTGDLSKEPVATEFGYHIIRMNRRIDGELLPFEAVADWIADYFRKSSWQRAFSQYIQLLAGNAKITGFDLQCADTPLVQ